MIAMHASGVLLVLLTIAKFSSGQEDECLSFSWICADHQANCEDCIRAHPCCVWCYDEAYKERRCGIAESLKETCNPRFLLKNQISNVTEIKNEAFTNIQEGDVSDAEVIQMRPQEFDIHLRKDEPINITIEYQAAKNYPLDLYYLMDLTLSMKEDLKTMTQLGEKLTELLKDLTTNHRIAFGSYVDKKEMPFYLTDPDNIGNPCKPLGTKCEEGYLFKHKLNFTENIEDFIRNLENSTVSANTDNLEGGFDALMQILLCDKELGWLDKSRKVVLLVTESMMHLAGDGILSGSTKRNKKCLIDHHGNYMTPILYDYPSIEEIYRQLKRRKINVIIAAKKHSIFYYKQLHELIPEATFVDELESDSTNVLELVKDGYYDFMRRTTLSLNTSSVDGLQVDVFADCFGNGYMNKTGTCYNVEEGKAIRFTVQLLLKEYQESDGETLFVEERSIDEKVKLNVKFVDSKCECSMLMSLREPQFCGHGKYVCGNCTCMEGWTGNTCTEVCDTKEAKCRYRDESTLHMPCFGNGNCICGRCECDPPFSGQFCNYSCPYDTRTKQVCGGPSHGLCKDGTCLCTAHQYKGDDCSCSLSQESCKIPGTAIMCNGHGKCECNRCNCDEGYQGRFCETCNECEGLCNVYMPCVVTMVHNKTEDCTIGNAAVKSSMVDVLNPDIPHYCYYRYNQNCETRYSYTIKRKNMIEVEILEPSCYEPVQAIFSIGGIILASILGVGLLTLLIWKWVTVKRDKVEYQQFMKEQQSASHREENPLYKSPIVTYNNPMEMSSFSSFSKDD